VASDVYAVYKVVVEKFSLLSQGFFSVTCLIVDHFEVFVVWIFGAAVS
jgi:hypothetical protein